MGSMALPAGTKAIPYVHSFGTSQNFVVLPIFTLDTAPAAVRASAATPTTWLEPPSIGNGGLATSHPWQLLLLLLIHFRTEPRPYPRSPPRYHGTPCVCFHSAQIISVVSPQPEGA